MDSYTLNLRDHQQIPIIAVTGYFAAEAGQESRTVVRELLEKGQTRISMDFSECRLINSPGVVAIMQIAMQFVEDYSGRIVLVGLDDLKITVLEMAGVLPLAETADSLDQAAMILA